MAGRIDLEKAGNYPIVLSDALKGRGTKDVYTGIRYNHKPDLSEDTTEARLKPPRGRGSMYEVSIKDGSDQYKYEGTRHTKDDQYVLIFVPEKQHFVLHQIDSSFDMNLIETPEEKSAAILASEYDQLNGSSALKPRRKTATQTKVADKAPARKNDKPKKKPPKRAPTPDAEDEDSDDGLTIEYPDGPPPPRFQHSTPIYRREPSVESDADADFEDDEPEERNKDVEELTLPSPVRNVDVAGADDDDDGEEELDLEAELEMALEKEMEPTSKGDESSESEEE